MDQLKKAVVVREKVKSYCRNRADALKAFYSRAFRRNKTSGTALEAGVPTQTGEWQATDFLLDKRGLLLNEKEQYKEYDSLRELIINNFDAGATETRVDVDGCKIEIVGNGYPITSVDDLKKIFTTGKRKNKTIKDIDGNERRIIGEKGRGRLAFTRDAKSIEWRSEFGSFKLEVPENEADIIVHQNLKKNGAHGTEVILKGDHKYNAEHIKNALTDIFKWFGGQNFDIYYNGAKLETEEFKPTHAVLACIGIDNEEAIAEEKKVLRSADVYKNGTFTVDLHINDARMTAATLDDKSRKKVAKADSGEAKKQLLSVLLSVESDETKNREITCLSQKLEAKKLKLDIDLPVSFIVGTRLQLKPARDGFADVYDEDGRTVISSHRVDELIKKACESALLAFIGEKGNLSSGWHKIESPYYQSFIEFASKYSRVDSSAALDIETKLYEYEGNCIISRRVSLEELRSLFNAEDGKKVMLLSEDEKNQNRADRAIQQGASAIVFKDTDNAEKILKALGIGHYGFDDPEFWESYKDTEVNNVGAKNRVERAFVKKIEKMMKKLEKPVKEMWNSIEDFDVGVDVADLTEAKACHLFMATEDEPNILFDRETFEEVMGRKCGQMEFEMRVASTVTHELAHWAKHKRGYDAKTASAHDDEFAQVHNELLVMMNKVWASELAKADAKAKKQP